MNRREYAESSATRLAEPLVALALLAEEAGAGSIADDLRRVHSQLAEARYTVAIVGDIETRSRILERICGRKIETVSSRVVIRFGRGAWRACRASCSESIPVILSELHGVTEPIELIGETALLETGACFVVGDTHHVPPSCVLTTDRDHLLACDDRRDTLPVLIVDHDSAADLDTALSWIATRAVETGASHVEQRLLRQVRDAGSRLQFHLSELGRALEHSEHQLRARTTALMVAGVVARKLFGVTRHQPDRRRDTLASWLAIERTKFIMGTKADALAALDDRLRGISCVRRELRQQCADAAQMVLVPLLAGYWRRIRPHTELPVVEVADQLIEELEHALTDLAGGLPIGQAMMGLDAVPLRGFEAYWPVPLHRGVRLRDRVGSRKRLHELAREALVDALDRYSASINEQALEAYDDNRSRIEVRFRHLLDSARRTVQASNELRQSAVADGDRGVARARTLIAGWSRALAALMATIE